MSQVRTISLFSGCGGSDLALKSLGYNVVWANDITDVACQTYADNLGPVIECGDITNFERFPTADFLVGCYPCQGFTQGGRRTPGDSVNFLYQQFDRVLRKVRPRAFVVENVNGMAFGENRTLLENQLRRYRLAGYRVNWRVLDAQHFQVAQTRKRVFIVGIRSDLDFEYEFPEAVNGPGTNRLPRSQKEALAGFPEWPEGSFNVEPFHWYYLSRRRRHEWDEPSACIVGTYVIYPWYRAKPPANVARDALVNYPKALLLSKPQTADWHEFGMEWKEHIAWFTPILATAVAFVVTRYRRQLAHDPQVRRMLLIFITASFFCASIAGLFGAMINKAAPTR